ncbi:MAG: SAM-dependent methyltransferase [Gammaproteobacteria bacterium HGW-Gammaproteobacteria-1]|nr:MAG: SAM-dependent methyltransferase [Gammaproteobacteria bacterium HGW-Gammaproteobacteria-1]
MECAQNTLFRDDAREAAVEALHAATAIYTAEPVVDDLLAHVGWPRADRCLVDPSCGDGIFLGRALHKLLQARPAISAGDLVAVLEGWEVHPFAASQARGRLAGQLAGHGWSAGAAAEVSVRIVRNADFLTHGPVEGRRYHVIAGNPPYLRAVNIPAVLRAEYSEVTPKYAQADLLHTFLDRCASLLAPDGVVAMVTADRWLFNANASQLRQELGRRVGVRHLERLDVSTAFYRPKQRQKGTPPRIHPVSVVLEASGGRPLTGQAIHPGVPDIDVASGRTLGDIAGVRQGPWLGTPGIFVVDEDGARQLPPECLVPAVGPRDIVNGKIGPIRRWAIRTDAGEPPPAPVMAHLEAALPRMALRGRRSPCWVPPESWGPLPYDRPSLLIPRIATGVRPVLLPAGVLPLNHDVSIVAAEGEPLTELEKLLTSEEADRWFKARAPRLESGYFSVTTTLLRQLPV